MPTAHALRRKKQRQQRAALALARKAQAQERGMKKLWADLLDGHDAESVATNAFYQALEDLDLDDDIRGLLIVLAGEWGKAQVRMVCAEFVLLQAGATKAQIAQALGVGGPDPDWPARAERYKREGRAAIQARR